MNRTYTAIALFAAAAVSIPLAANEPVDDGRSYGYFTGLEGSASLIASDGTRSDAELNLPVLPGDQLSLGGSSRAELFLPDASLLRLEAGSHLVLRSIAWSAGVEDVETTIEVGRGEVLVSLGADAAPTSFSTPNASAYLAANGIYRVIAENGRSRVLVREGRAEVTTTRGSTVVLAGEEALINGSSSPRTTVATAPPRDSLERWAAQRDSDGQWDGDQYVDERVRYAAAPLARYGDWVEVDGNRAWRPVHVVADWSPYREGRWMQTGVGLTWVSYDPWGSVPYHYGSWDWADRWGWVWYPGRRWAPAHVTWYWGPRYVGWCPTGWYHRRGYGPNINININFGVFGWAGGRSRDWDHWRFVDYDGLRDRRVGRHTRTAHALSSSGVHELGRGLLTTDTRPMARLRNIDGTSARSAWDREIRAAGRVPDQLPDVTALAVRPRGELDRATRDALTKPVRIASDPTTGRTRSATGRSRDQGAATSEVGATARPRATGREATGPATSARPSVTRPSVARPVAARPTAARPATARPESRPGAEAAQPSATRGRVSSTDGGASTVGPARPRAGASDDQPTARQPVVRPRAPVGRTGETPVVTSPRPRAARPTVSTERAVPNRPTASSRGDATAPSPAPRAEAPRRESAPRVLVRPGVDAPRRPTSVAPPSSTPREPPVRRVIESRRQSTQTPAPRATSREPVSRGTVTRETAPQVSSPRSTAPRPSATAPRASSAPRSTTAPPRATREYRQSTPPPASSTPRASAPARREQPSSATSGSSNSSRSEGRSRSTARSRGDRND